VGNNNDETADPPFDFAQGRLFGDDNQNCNDKNNGNERLQRQEQLMTTKKKDDR
jgi:hypothetical protein